MARAVSRNTNSCARPFYFFLLSGRLQEAIHRRRDGLHPGPRLAAAGARSCVAPRPCTLHRAEDNARGLVLENLADVELSLLGRSAREEHVPVGVWSD